MVGRKRGGLGGFRTFIVICVEEEKGSRVGLNKAVKVFTASWNC
jgi:hypothetical protein